MALKVSLDIDGVLTDLEESVIQFSKKYFGKTVLPQTIDNWELTNTGLTRHEVKIMFSSGYFYKDSIPSKFVTNITDFLYENFIVIIKTFRPEYLKSITINWLEKCGVKYHDIIFLQQDESKALNVDFFIEDAPHIVTDFLANNVPGLVVSHLYNSELKNNNQCENLFHFVNADDDILSINKKLNLLLKKEVV